MPIPPISLIFVNFRSAERLEGALESLVRFPLPAGTEIIIVNNDPDETADLETLARVHGAILIPLEENKGFGGGINRGVEAASGRVLGFINPDVLFTEPVLGPVLDMLREREILGLRLMGPDGAAQAYDHGREVTLGWLLGNHTGRNPLPHENEIAWVSGCAMFISREFFNVLGGFDERFFLYYEDIDLCRRAKQAGGTVRYLQSASLIHLSGGSQISRKSQKTAYFRSQRVYFRKHRPFWERLTLPLFQAAKRLFP